MWLSLSTVLEIQNFSRTTAFESNFISIQLDWLSGKLRCVTDAMTASLQSELNCVAYAVTRTALAEAGCMTIFDGHWRAVPRWRGSNFPPPSLADQDECTRRVDMEVIYQSLGACYSQEDVPPCWQRRLLNASLCTRRQKINRRMKIYIRCLCRN